MKRVLFLSSSRFPWFESQEAAEHFREAPYSINAIGYHLEKRGWKVAWAGWETGRSPRALARRIDTFLPDVIYTYGSTLALHPLFCRRFLCRHKGFLVVHGWDDEYGVLWNELFGWPGRIFMNWMERRIVKNSDAVVTLSRFLQQKGRRWGVECHYIPNGADPVNRAAALAAPGPTLEGAFRVVYTGDMARWKNVESLCAAMRRLPPDTRLFLTGRDRPWLRPYASENCVFLGWLSKEEQFHVMAQADAFVTTSDQDCNAKLQEYLRWHRPILAWDGRPNLFFQNGRNALLTRDWAAAIARLRDDPALCATLAENAATDIPVYSWAEIAEQFDRLFEMLAAPRAQCSCGSAPAPKVEAHAHRACAAAPRAQCSCGSAPAPEVEAQAHRAGATAPRAQCSCGSAPAPKVEAQAHRACATAKEVRNAP